MKGLSNRLAVVSVVAVLSGCSAATTAISHRNLDVQSKMTDTIFLDPVSPDQRTVFIQCRNSSDKANFDFGPELQMALSAKGYTVINDFKAAHYVVQANVLQVGKIDPSAAEQMFLGGFGSAVAGAGAGSMIGALAGRSTGGMLAGGILGGVTSVVADSLVKNVTYSIITDVQISEISDVAVQQTTNSQVKQGTTTTKTQVSAESTNKRTYQTRIMSTANQVNLDFEDAVGPLKNGLVKSISGVF